MPKNGKAAAAMRYASQHGVSLKEGWAHVKRGGGSPRRSRSGGNHTAKKKHRGGGRSKGLFGTGLPKVGDMVQGAYGAEQLGGFDALAALTNPDIAVKDRLNSAYVAVRSKITAVGPIVNTILGLTIINVGLKVSRKVGGKWVRKWL